MSQQSQQVFSGRYEIARHIARGGMAEVYLAQDLMITVVNAPGGTGGRARVDGATVGGKTGTAQTTGDNAHAWFIGFGEGNGRKVAVSVIVESQEGLSEATGGRVAAPIAQAVLKATLGL